VDTRQRSAATNRWIEAKGSARRRGRMYAMTDAKHPLVLAMLGRAVEAVTRSVGNAPRAGAPAPGTSAIPKGTNHHHHGEATHERNQGPYGCRGTLDPVGNLTNGLPPTRDKGGYSYDAQVC
jgi:hypothetical protein